MDLTLGLFNDLRETMIYKSIDNTSFATPSIHLLSPDTSSCATVLKMQRPPHIFNMRRAYAVVWVGSERAE